jgi:hypothetical protein
MGTLTRTRWIYWLFRHHAPIELVEKRAIALDERIMRKHLGHRLLVKDERFWYHEHGKLLVEVVISITLCLKSA